MAKGGQQLARAALTAQAQEPMREYAIDKECVPPNGLTPFPSHCRKTMVAKVVMSRTGIDRVSFPPVFINPQAQPYVVTPDDPKFQEILEFTEWVSDQHPHAFRVDGNEVVVDTSGR
jgi:hypothetical protein